MRGLIIATGYRAALEPLVRRRPSALFRIVDKPIIVHLIERLVRLDVRHLDIVLCHLPHLIESVLEEGKRWGVKITYHLVRDSEHPLTVIVPAAQTWPERVILLANADILPKLHHKQLDHWRAAGATLLFHATRGWLGWGVVPVAVMKGLNRETPFTQFPNALPTAHKVRMHGVLMSVQTLRDWQLSNHKVLSAHAPTSLFPATSHMVEPGVWLSRATMIHPTAEINGPVYIGENCQIREEAQVGPDTVVESHSIIDRGSEVTRALICQESYVGEGLAIHDSIVDQHTLVNLAHDATVSIADDFILSHLETLSLRRHAMNIASRLVAFALLLIFAPFLGLLAWCYGIKTTDIVRLPADAEGEEWPTFELLSFNTKSRWSTFASLVNIARGQMRFVGVTPRTLPQLQALSPEWRRMILEAQVGLVNLVDADPALERDASDVFYCARQTPFYDLRLLFRAFLRKFSGLFRNDRGSTDH